ncbi:MAG: Holliday junction branch migration protein RuvA [Treponema sp.]|nr:Holliday junction branch migration protein RuvA [Treponema sp.]
MFNSLKGVITYKAHNTVHLDVNGWEWDLSVPASTIDELPDIGTTAKIYTWMYVREDQMKMFGFASEEERDVFLDLLKVEGVGAKGAVKILSNIAISKFVEALDAGNTEVLEAVSGIGKKTAAKIMLTLKGKLSLEDSTKSAQHTEQAEFQDVINSLVDMGYDKRDVTEVVDRITDQLMENSEFTSKSHSGKEEMIFRQALVDLA